MANFIAPEKQYYAQNRLKAGFERYQIARYYLWLAIFLLLSVFSWQFILAQAEVPMSITLSQSSAAQNVLVNSTSNYLDRFVFTNNSQEMVNFTTIWISRDASSSLNGTLYKNFYLYDNENGLNVAGPQNFSSSVDGIYFQNLNWQVGPLTTKSLSLVADLEAGAEDNLKVKFDLDLSRSVFAGQNSGTPVTVTPNPSKVEGVWLTAKSPKVILSKSGSSPVGLKTTPESKDVNFLIFNLQVNDAEKVYLKELKVKINNASIDDLSIVKVYNEAGSLLTSQAVVYGTINFTFSDVELFPSTDNKLYLKADINQLNKVTLNAKPYLSIDTSSDIILKGKTSNAYAKVSGFATGNEVEIIASQPAQKSLELKFEKKLESEDKASPAATLIPNSLSYEDGVAASAVRSNNSGAYVDYSCSGYFDNNQGTLEVWVKFDSTKGADQYFWETDNALFSLQYDYESQGTVQKRIKAMIGGNELSYVFQTATSSDVWKNAEWKHLALSWGNSAGQAKLYVNGVKQQTVSYVGSKSCTNFRLLNDHAAIVRGFIHGALDEFKLYNYVRDDTQILSDFTAYNYIYQAPSAPAPNNASNPAASTTTPQTLPGAGDLTNDSDNDQVSDVLEDLFGTDKLKNDSDNDGFSDANELNNCYNPRGSDKICDSALIGRLMGRIILAVEAKGQAFYISPTDKKAHYLGRAQDAYNVMRTLGLGAKNVDLQKIPTKDENFTGDLNLRRRLSGRILLQVEGKGEAWYVSPINLKRYYLGRAEDAFQIMRSLGLGISTVNLKKLPLFTN